LTTASDALGAEAMAHAGTPAHESTPRPSRDIDVERALAFIETHGIVLASARGAAPRLIDAIAGETIVGNWWSHPRANAIYDVLERASGSPDVLACRLVDGKVTLVHRRLWPALVRLADRFAPERIAQVRNEHMASGRHIAQHVPFPDWVPADVSREAAGLDDNDAVVALAAWLPATTPASAARKR
jgi:hypothetical protein